MSKKHPRSRERNPDSSPQPPQKAKIKDVSIHVPQRSKVDWPIGIRERDDLTPRQREIIDLILDKKTKIVFLNGPAGTSKTFLGVYCGLHLLNQHRASHITYVRTVIESASRSLGFLPGELDTKMEPYLMPLTDKLEEMVSAGDAKRLLLENRIVGIPVNFLRGANLNAQYIITDEAQNLCHKEMVTVLTRLGQYSKMVFLGDSDQSDINGASAFMPMFDLFNDESSRAEGIHCVSLTRADIVRSGTVRYIVERLENQKANRR